VGSLIPDFVWSGRGNGIAERHQRCNEKKGRGVAVSAMNRVLFDGISYQEGPKQAAVSSYSPGSN